MTRAKRRRVVVHRAAYERLGPLKWERALCGAGSMGRTTVYTSFDASTVTCKRCLKHRLFDTTTPDEGERSEG